MTSIADSAVTIQISSQSVPSTPTWLGEVTDDSLTTYTCAGYVRHVTHDEIADAVG